MKKITELVLCLGCAYVLAVAYSLFSGPVVAEPGGYAICYGVAIVFAPENCLAYAEPFINVPDDI